MRTNNITSTLNRLYAMRDIRTEARLVKLGTMGEYGIPPIDGLGRQFDRAVPRPIT